MSFALRESSVSSRRRWLTFTFAAALCVCYDSARRIGLAYHLAHTAGHDMTEEMVSGFAATLQSKTRWWYAKMGRALG